jgi:hypothetical protein
MKNLSTAIARGLALLTLGMFAASALVPLMFIAGFGAATAGVYLLAGLGWALVAAAAFLLTIAALIARGMTHA